MLFKAINFSNKEELLREYLDFLADHSVGQVSYVSGAISPKNGFSVEENIRKLNHYSRHVDEADFFSITIDPSLVGDLEKMGYSRDDALWVWASLITSGYVDTIVMTPGFAKSGGAMTELEAAHKQGLHIVYL